MDLFPAKRRKVWGDTLLTNVKSKLYNCMFVSLHTDKHIHTDADRERDTERQRQKERQTETERERKLEIEIENFNTQR